MIKNDKKIAVFHNYMDNIGGAEMVTLFLARGLNADLYTTNINEEYIKNMGFEDVLPRIKSIGQVPKMAPFRHQLALYRFRKLNLGRQYDFYIISGDWAMSGVCKNKPNMWYVHGPANELWDWYGYVRKTVVSWWKKPIFDVWVYFNRFLNLWYAKNVNIWVCNSSNVQKRIAKYYKANATIINPPVNMSLYTTSPSKGYWLAVNRLFAHKRIEIQLEAFKDLPNEKLIIVGSYEKEADQFQTYKNKIDSLKPDNVEILHWVEDSELKKLYAECKGFITTARDEDFGMTPIEAMASGKPVIAGNEGGYKETIVDGLTGILIDDIDSTKLKNAIKKISEELKEDPNKYKEACLNRAKEFDVNIFIEKIKNMIDSKINKG